MWSSFLLSCPVEYGREPPQTLEFALGRNPGAEAPYPREVEAIAIEFAKRSLLLSLSSQLRDKCTSSVDLRVCFERPL